MSPFNLPFRQHKARWIKGKDFLLLKTLSGDNAITSVVTDVVSLLQK